MDNIFLRLHPDYDSLSDLEKSSLMREKHFIESNHDRLVEFCRECEVRRGMPISDGMLAFVVRCAWATILHKMLHPEYNDLVSGVDPIYYERAAIERNLPAVLDSWDEYRINSENDIDALRQAVRDVWSNELFLKLHPDYQFLSDDVKAVLMLKRQFIRDYLYDVVGLYAQYSYTMEGVTSEGKLKQAVDQCWSEVISLQLHPNVNSMSASDYSRYIEEKVFMAGHMLDIMKLYYKYGVDDSTLDHYTRLRCAVKTEWSNHLFSRLHPDYDSLPSVEREGLDDERVFIEGHLDAVLEQYAQNMCDKDENDSDLLLRDAVDEVWAQDLFKTLYPDYDSLSYTEMCKANQDKIRIKNNLTQVVKSMQDFGCNAAGESANMFGEVRI